MVNRSLLNFKCQPVSYSSFIIPHSSFPQNQMAERGAAGRRAREDVWAVAGLLRVTVCDLFDGRARAARAQHGDGAAAAAARDLRAVQPPRSPGLADEFDETIRALHAQAARRVARVRLVHQLAEQPQAFAARGAA